LVHTSELASVNSVSSSVGGAVAVFPSSAAMFNVVGDGWRT
jgi:hypothetical protein